MGGQWTVHQPRGGEQPALPVRLQDERVCPGVCLKTDAIRPGRCIRRLGEWEVRHVEAGPLLPIPPDPLLALAPGLACRIGRGPVVQDAPIGRPGEAPVEVGPHDAGWVRLSAGGAVLLRRRKDPRVDPGRARCGAVVLQLLGTGQVAARGSLEAVDLLEDLADVRLVYDPRVL